MVKKKSSLAELGNILFDESYSTRAKSATVLNIFFTCVSISYLFKLKQRCPASNTTLNKVTFGLLILLLLSNLYTIFIDPCIGLGYGIFTHIFIAHLYQMKYKCPDVDIWERKVFEGLIWFSVAMTFIFTITSSYLFFGPCHDALKRKKSKK